MTGLGRELIDCDVNELAIVPWTGPLNCPIFEPFFDLDQIRNSGARAIVNGARSRATAVATGWSSSP
jgi:hypothetical protein